MNRETAEAATILRSTVGSTIHGLNVQDGLEDLDEMAICIEPIEEAMGLGAPFEQFVYRSAAEREGKHDAPSQAGDLDLTIYSLRKYCRLALKGNPTVLTLLFVPEDQLIRCDARGSQLRDLAPKIVSKQAGKAFLGYLQAQRQRLLGERGNGGHGSPRRGLTEKFGFDTKFAMHMLRLGYQGIELLETGKLTFPMERVERQFLLDVRNGKESLNTCLTEAGQLESELKLLMDASELPDEPDSEAVEAWMIKTYFRTWSSRQSIEDIKLFNEAFAARVALYGNPEETN